MFMTYIPLLEQLGLDLTDLQIKAMRKFEKQANLRQRSPHLKEIIYTEEPLTPRQQRVLEHFVYSDNKTLKNTCYPRWIIVENVVKKLRIKRIK
jgi:hypothetical protein